MNCQASHYDINQYSRVRSDYDINQYTPKKKLNLYTFYYTFGNRDKKEEVRAESPRQALKIFLTYFDHMRKKLLIIEKIV